MDKKPAFAEQRGEDEKQANAGRAATSTHDDSRRQPLNLSTPRRDAIQKLCPNGPLHVAKSRWRRNLPGSQTTDAAIPGAEYTRAPPTEQLPSGAFAPLRRGWLSSHHVGKASFRQWVRQDAVSVSRFLPTAR